MKHIEYQGNVNSIQHSMGILASHPTPSNIVTKYMLRQPQEFKTPDGQTTMLPFSTNTWGGNQTTKQNENEDGETVVSPEA